MLTVTIDEKSISCGAAGQIDFDSIVTNFSLPHSDARTKCVRIGEHAYILSRSFQPHDALLTIALTTNGPLSALPNDSEEEVLARIMRCAVMLATGRTRAIPVSWRAFHQKNRLSFQAMRKSRSAHGGRTDAGRIVLELSQGVGQRVFAFLLDANGAKDLSLLEAPSFLLNEALTGVAAALAAKDSGHPVAKGTREFFGKQVTLEPPPPESFRAQMTADEWYRTGLTTAQRDFVDHPHDRSVRLVGPAGTGKTLALVVKCLRDLQSDSTGRQRFLFLTHACGTEAAVENLARSMEPDLCSAVMDAPRPRLVVTTLYALANRQMRYDLDELTPVSLDGYEGRAFQADALNDVINRYRAGDWIAFRSGCSEPFRAYMEAAPDSMERRFFLWEVLNEFACVLDAEGIRSGTERREQYLTERRRNWMMFLSSKEERQVILSLYEQFRSWLRDIKAIGGDQMVTDFLNHLDSFRWEATRATEGFDAVFVDELHLFNRQERLVFRHLLRSPKELPAVFMAYDAKQSPRDTFLRLPSWAAQQLDFWRDAKLGPVDKIELVDVFRYTPQIARALALIDESFPGQDLDEDWPNYSGISKVGDGPVPTIHTTRSTVDTYTRAFRRAQELQKELGRTGRVAVLCASNELFKRYLEFSDLRKHYVAITSRDEASAISGSARKFVFSMPEYVAGLQFHTVLLIDVNQGEVPEGPYAAASLRKFAAQVYLGASRAERVLEMYSSQENGGVAAMLSRAVYERAILSA